jgi:hypothetical protein
LIADEEDQLLALFNAKGWNNDKLAAAIPDAMARLVIARVNDARLPVLEEGESQLITRRGEVVHAEMDAQLGNEVIDRELRGGSAGVSIPLGHGVRFRYGNAAAHSVVVGSHPEAVDAGVLSVSSQRVVFLGERKTLACAYSKLVGLQLYADAIRISVSNRETPALFFADQAEPLAAIIGGAVRKGG